MNWHASRFCDEKFSGSGCSLSPAFVKKLLKPGEDAADTFGFAQVGNGVGHGVVVTESQQRRQLLLIEFGDSFGHVVSQHELQKCLLLFGGA
jgi:hypothetical protein